MVRPGGVCVRCAWWYVYVCVRAGPMVHTCMYISYVGTIIWYETRRDECNGITCIASLHCPLVILSCHPVIFPPIGKTNRSCARQY